MQKRVDCVDFESLFQKMAERAHNKPKLPPTNRKIIPIELPRPKRQFCVSGKHPWNEDHVRGGRCRSCQYIATKLRKQDQNIKVF